MAKLLSTEPRAAAQPGDQALDDRMLEAGVADIATDFWGLID